MFKNNIDKYVCMYLSSSSASAKPLPLPLEFGATTVEQSRSARNLGVLIDQHLTINQHVSDVVRKSFFLLRCISKVCKLVDTPTCNTLVCSLVFPHLDYSNSLLAGTPMCTFDRLQRVQNAAAKVVAGRARVRSERLESIKRSLYWLPIRERIDYKITILTFKALNNMAVELVIRYQPPRPLKRANHNLLQTSHIHWLPIRDKALNNMAPSYMVELVNRYQSPQPLKSANHNLLQTSQIRLARNGTRSFSHSAHDLWNSRKYTVI